MTVSTAGGVSRTPAEAQGRTRPRRTAGDRRNHARYTTDYFTNQPKLADVHDPVERMAAIGLHGASIGISNELGGDGHVIAEDVLRQTGLSIEYAKALIAAGMWHQADHGCVRCPQPREGHVYVHDFLEHSRTAAEDRALAEKRREAAEASHVARRRNRPPAAAGVEQPKRRPGRPRKNQAPETADASGSVQQGAVVLVHPAQARAAAAVAAAEAKKVRAPKAPKVFEQWVIDAANALADGIAANDPNGLRPNVTDTWLNDIRLMHEKDGREPEKIMKAIQWSQNHHTGSGDFGGYSTIIKSPKKLRQHFSAMHTRAIAEHRQGAAVRPLRGAPAAVSVPGINSLYDDDDTPIGALA